MKYVKQDVINFSILIGMAYGLGAENTLAGKITDIASLILHSTFYTLWWLLVGILWLGKRNES